MGKPISILTDVNTANAFELLLLKMNDVQESVNRLHPLDSIQLYDEEEAASLLHIHKRTLITLRKEHKIQFIKIESRILYSVVDIVEYEGRCRQSLTLK